jgi:hypothetical protein
MIFLLCNYINIHCKKDGSHIEIHCIGKPCLNNCIEPKLKLTFVCYFEKQNIKYLNQILIFYNIKLTYNVTLSDHWPTFQENYQTRKSNRFY